MKLFTHKYGINWPHRLDRRSLEWSCFLWGHKLTKGGLGRSKHFRNAFALTWPHVKWSGRDSKGNLVVNRWAMRMINAFCNDEHVVQKGGSTFRFIGLSGCGAAGKSFWASAFTAGWWHASPSESIAVITSTTKEMARRRVWSNVSKFHSDIVSGEGHVVDSRMEITYENPDSKVRDARHAICVLAVAHGETRKAFDNLKGMHAPRMLLVIDEANSTPEAIFTVISNWRIAATDMTVIIIGNPLSRLDNHGRAIEPEIGWDKIHSDTLEWRSKRVPEWDLDSGIVLRFDGSDSPNVLAGENVFPYIYRLEDWQSAKERGENTLAFWTQHRGLHPPEGILEAVLNETALANAHINDSLQFVGKRTPCMFLDPAFGGDAAILVIGECGSLENLQVGLQLIERIEIPIEITEGAQEPDLQLAMRFVEIAKSRGIRPEHCGLDATGTGRGVFSFIATLWSNEIMRFEASESPGQEPILEGDRRPAKEAYLNRITESWVRIGSLVRTGQLKGMEKEAQIEFTQRKLEEPRISKGRQRLEDKKDFKLRIGHSPDDADAVGGLGDLCAKRLGLVVANVVRAQREVDTWDAFVRRFQEPFEELQIA
jgi:hypothetical protein